MPADRNHHSASGSQPPGLWPGEDVPRQQGAPATAPPWPEPGAGQPTQLLATDVRTEPRWSDGDQPTQVGPSAQPWPDGGYPPGPGGTEPPWTLAGPAAPPPDPSRRRWRVLVAAAVTLAVAGGGVAVAANRGQDRVPTEAAAPAAQSAAPTAAPAPGAVAPSPTPGGVEGMGGRPASPSASAAASAGPVAGFSGTRLTLPGSSIGVQSGETFNQALARTDRTFGRLKMARIFFPGLPPAWKGSRADVVDRTVVVSFKASPQEINAGKHDSRLASWFASIPREHNVYWSYFHEPEDDVERGAFTTAAYRTAWRRIAGLANRADNPKLINTLILMCWSLDPKSGRSFDAFYPGGDVIETLGWDCYNWGVKTKQYASPKEIYGRMIDKSRDLGKPWGVAETGSDLVPGDSGTGRAAWLRSMSTYLNGQRPEFVAYYNQVVSQGDFRLLDSPSIQAWRSFCTA